MQTARRHAIFFLVAILFGIVSVAAGIHFLRTGEIAIREAGGQRTPVDSGPAVGRIRSGDALFYPLAIGWIAVGATILVAAPLALITGSNLFGLTATLATAGVLIMGFSTVGAAYWYGDDSSAAKEPIPAVAPANGAAP